MKQKGTAIMAAGPPWVGFDPKGDRQNAFRWTCRTTEVDTGHPLSMNRGASLSFPHLGLSSLIWSTAVSSTMLQVGFLSGRDQPAWASSPSVPRDVVLPRDLAGVRVDTYLGGNIGRPPQRGRPSPPPTRPNGLISVSVSTCDSDCQSLALANPKHFGHWVNIFAGT